MIEHLNHIDNSWLCDGQVKIEGPVGKGSSSLVYNGYIRDTKQKVVIKF